MRAVRSAPVSAAPTTSPLQARRRLRGRLGDFALHALTFVAAIGSVVLVAAIVWRVFRLSGAIGLYLSELAPRGVRGVVGSLVELLAAIPSVVLGLWGILVLGPFVAEHLGP